MAVKKKFDVKLGERLNLRLKALSRELIELTSDLETFIIEAEESETEANSAIVEQTKLKLNNKIEEAEGKIDRLLRLREVLAYIDVGKSCWWNGVKTGKYPQPTYALGSRMPRWRLSSIMQLVNAEQNFKTSNKYTQER